MPSFEGNRCTQGHEILSRKLDLLGAAHSKDFVILACTVLIRLKGVTDKHRQTPGRWLKRAKRSAIARKNGKLWFTNKRFHCLIPTDAKSMLCVLSKLMLLRSSM